MRQCILLAAVTLWCGAGCTHLALERRTVYQASTTTDLQYQQVLDNIAMFTCTPHTMPFHLNLQTGSVQVTDQGISGAAGARPAGGIAALGRGSYGFGLLPSFSAQRGVVNQWGGVPTIDSEPLELLTLAYRKAIDPLDQEGTLRAQIYEKIAEVAVHYNLVLNKETLDEAIDNSRLDLDKKWKLKQKNEEFHDRLEEVFKQFAKLSLPPTDVQVDNYAQGLSKKLTEESRGEARAKLQAQQAQQTQQLQVSRIGVEDQIVRMTRELTNLPYIPRYPATGRGEHNSQTITQAQRKVVSLRKLASDPQFAEPWVGCVPCARIALRKGDCDSTGPHCDGDSKWHGCEGDYIGHHQDKRGCHCEVHVSPARLGTLRDFTLIVLDLSPIEIQDTTSGATTGTVTYSPVLTTH